ncbi:glycosyltransferase family 2 protein [Vibrio variabilis]|uniref:glycosyltransferase family 2 protein n=1 Tax=Vibrio variabilis TaxID=990271 RepID=UPI000DDB3052|nr:glycosyltransferase family 2 protein [Vibrio variabilis]
MKHARLNQLCDWAVIVFYFPDEDAIKHALWLQKQYQQSNGQLVVVDNTPYNIKELDTQQHLAQFKHYIANNDNLGIAKALNDGIDYALNHGADWCFLFDQDSRPDGEFFRHMRAARDHLTRCKKQFAKPVAAIAPVYYDTNLQRCGRIVQIQGSQLSRLRAPQHMEWASYTITSGSYLCLAHYHDIGAHDESLFIDFVDIDWGLRANAKGYQIHVIPAAKLTHSLGIQPVSVFGVNMVNHSATRHYYYFRNLIHMLKRSYVPRVWKRTELLKLVPRFIVYSLFTNNKRHHMTAMLQGTWHGLKNKVGKRD